MIQNEHPIAILGYALTLEGFAAKKAAGIFPNVAALYGDKCTSFIKLHCEVDVEHFDNALPHLNACPEHLLPIIAQGVDQCCAIYKGILTDITEHVSAKSRTQVASTVLSC